jgi:hypothetical protein
MPRTISATRWAAVRALREGAAPTYPLLAVATNLHPATIRERASLENWEKQPFQSSKAREAWPGRARPAAPATGEGAAAPDLSELQALERPQDQIAWLSAYVVRALGNLIASAKAGALDKAEIDSLSSLMRMLERSKTLAPERAADNQTENDAELAETLRRIDDRIVELAEAHAKWLVSRRYPEGTG